MIEWFVCGVAAETGQRLGNERLGSVILPRQLARVVAVGAGNCFKFSKYDLLLSYRTIIDKRH